MDHAKRTLAELTRTSEKEYRAAPKLPLAILVDNVRSMANIGAIFRTSDAFLVSRIILAGISGTPPHREITKAALGAENTVEWTYAPDALEAARQMQRDGWRILALEQAHNSVELQNFRPQPGERYLLVPGNEVDGVDQRIVDLADAILEIPQHGVKHSLNVATSTSIALWHLYLTLR